MAMIKKTKDKNHDGGKLVNLTSPNHSFVMFLASPINEKKKYFPSPLTSSMLIMGSPTICSLQCEDCCGAKTGS